MLFPLIILFYVRNHVLSREELMFDTFNLFAPSASKLCIIFESFQILRKLAVSIPEEDINTMNGTFGI